MITLRSGDERGASLFEWLDSRHTFSFNRYFDPKHMGFRSLRVINDDRIAPGGGFGTHSHRDMEILTYVLAGQLAHKDSMGNGSVLSSGEVQLMSAGTGITHSEYNHSHTAPVHLLQIWILPEHKGIEPRYEQRAFPREQKEGRLCLIAARGGRGGAPAIRQDASIYATVLKPGQRVTHELGPGRHAWVQTAGGVLMLNGAVMQEGDGAAVSNETHLTIEALEPSEALVFDLA